MAGLVGRAGTLVQLAFGDDKKLLGKVTRRFQDVIEQSFVDDKSRITQNEVKRRFRICLEWYITLRRDLKWGVERICAVMPKALRAKLDRADWDPTKERSAWVGPE